MSLVKKTDFDSLKLFILIVHTCILLKEKNLMSQAFSEKLLKEQFNIHIVVNK